MTRPEPPVTMSAPMPNPPPAIAAQAELHHQLLLGLQLMVATHEGPQVVGDWMFRLFRQQHEDKFLSSFGKLGLEGLPHAVACARYHVLSNGIGGVAVEYMEESDTKAWVRFRYPRWMFDGAAICGVPLEASRGFLRGWYAHNGVSLGNPRLGFVCVSEDMSGQYGLCGYFREYEHVLDEPQRLVFAPHERPPPFDPARQPQPPEAQWDAERLAKARRNYALDYIRNGIAALVQVLGRERALALAGQAARLTGLQQYRRLADAVGGVDGGPAEAAAFLAAMFAGMGDTCRVDSDAEGVCARLHHGGLRLLRGLGDADAADLLACWTELWRGTVHSHRAFMELRVSPSDDGLCWTIEQGRATHELAA
jgi:hypothetical protein